MTDPLTPADAARLLADIATPYGALRLRGAAPALAEALAAHSDCISRAEHEAICQDIHDSYGIEQVVAERDATEADNVRLRETLAEATGLLVVLASHIDAFLAAHEGKQ